MFNRPSLRNLLIAALLLPLCNPPASFALDTSNADETQGISDKEILIGSCCALDGPVKFLGTEQIVGAKAYLSYVNDQGGVFGRKIKVNSYNDNYEPDQAIGCFNRLMNDHVFAGAFFVGTPTAAKYVPMAESHKVPLVGLYTGAQLLHDPFKHEVINIRASYYDETREQVEHLVNDLHIKRIAVIMQNDAFGAAVLAGVKKAMEPLHMEPVALASFQRNTIAVDEAVNTVRKASPEAVIMVGGYTPLADIVKYARKTGFNPIFTTVSFVGTEAFAEAAGDAADGVVITQVVPPYNKGELPAVKLYKKLLAKYDPKEKPNFTSFEGFIDAMVLVEGLKRAGKDLNRTKFISAIESIHNLDLGLGPHLLLDYSPTKHKGLNSVYFTVIRHGNPVSFTDWNDLKKKSLASH